MSKVDMSAHAITVRLKRVEQLRRLGLSLKKARLKKPEQNSEREKSSKPA